MRLSARLTAAAASLVLVTSLVTVVQRTNPGADLAAATGVCPPGSMTIDAFIAQERRVRDSAAAMSWPLAESEGAELLVQAGREVPGLCVSETRPEAFSELMMRSLNDASPRLAGMGPVREGALASAAAQRSAMAAGSVAGTAGRGRQYGSGPLDTTQFGTAGLGIPNSMGRVDHLEYDEASGRLFASVGTGGIWMSEDLGESWVEINGDLPITIAYSTGWTTAGGGRLIAITGDGSFGGITGFPGLGAYWTDDIGKADPADVHWEKAAGVPDDALGFTVAVNPASPNVVFVSTSKGLFRSTDGGATFTNTDLPTGACAGVTDTLARPECQLANVVTDVVVQQPGGATDVTTPLVVAAVGWRGGNFENADGTVQSEGNGIYVSTDGGATFAPTAMTGFTPLEQRGRIELGAAIGPDQDHNWLFAMVQDAQALNGQACAVIDAPVDCGPEIVEVAGLPLGSINTVLEGVYASADFGATWTKIATTETFQSPATGSALNGTASAIGFQPGTQAWYNQFVAPDPTLTDPVTGAPTRLVVGLEEVWENTDTSLPTEVPPTKPPVTEGTLFRVVGRYFAGTTCGFLDIEEVVASVAPATIPFPVCPLNTQDPIIGAETTHPDQHDGVWIPREDGGVDLLVGNDGGVFRQTVPDGADLTNTAWGPGKNNGFQTLLPYDVAPARDGRVWFGLQDNGSGFVDPTQGFAQLQTFGGDGFFVAVDPKNSDIAYYETTVASMGVTVDGGNTATGVAPPEDGGPYRFSNPFVMDPNDALQLATGGSRIYTTQVGPATTSVEFGTEPGLTDWKPVFDLGTNKEPGARRPAELAADEVLNQMSAIEMERNAVYVGFCGTCDILNAVVPFQNGIATNVGGTRPDASASADGWHVARAKGLPNRFITSIAIDPTDVRTLYVALGGYSRRWASPGTLQDANPRIGEGHVFRSTDAGESFTDWSGNLPDAVANWVELRGDQLLVGTDVGAFASQADGAPVYAPLEDLPATPISTIEMKPHDPNVAYLATYGRGVWEYTFDDTRPVVAYERRAGADRIQTAIEVSQAQFDRSETVVLATARVYADALAAVPLAAWEDAPILLTEPDALPDAVAAEIQRLGARTAIVAGGPVAIAGSIDDALRARGVAIDRVFGQDRFETAAEIAERLPVTSSAYVVEGADPDPGRGWPDALAVGTVAAEQGHPILLVETDRVPEATRRALASLQTDDVTIVGGPVAVAEGVATSLEESDLVVRRIAGADRYETAALLADAGIEARLTDHRVWVSRGDNWPDALAAGAAVSANGGTLLLVPPTDLSSSAAATDWIAQHSDDIVQVNVLGGDLAITPGVVDQIGAVIRAGVPPTPPPPPLKGELLAEYDFETDGQGWTASGSGTGHWQVSPPGDQSAQAWRVEPYQNETTTTITSPELVHEGGPLKVSWAMAYNTEGGFDFVSGTVRFADGSSAPLGGFTGLNASWPLFDAFEQTVNGPAGPFQVVFTMSSDQLVSQVGAAVDNVRIER